MRRETLWTGSLRFAAALAQPSARKDASWSMGPAVSQLPALKNSISGEFDELSGKVGGPSSNQCQDGCFFEDGDEGDDTQLGVVVGVGGEYAITNNVSFGLQYLWTHFDDSNEASR